MPNVLILGATSDIGFATAKKFAEEGYEIMLAGRNENDLRPLLSDIQARYDRACSIHLFDAMDFSSHKDFYNSLEQKPDITVWVVGYMADNDLAISSEAETLRTLHTNFSGAVSILNIIGVDYARRGKGTIAAISSVAGLRGRQSNYIYGSAKAGLTAYLSGLRNKLYQSNVHVVTILPGFVNTKMTAGLKLPKLLTSQPAQVADTIYRSIVKKKNIVFVKWYWRWIMFIIKAIPESVFKKKRL